MNQAPPAAAASMPATATPSAPPRAAEHAAFALASAALAWPLLAHDTLPLLDLPQHVGTVAILAGGPESFGFQRYYSVDLLGSPYLLPYLVAAALAQLVGAKLAVHALFAAAAAAWPWAMGSALSGLGRDRRAALLLGPLAYGTFAFLGFLNFALSLPLYLFWLGHFCRHLDDAKRRRRDLGAAAALGVLLFYGHVMTLGFALGSAALVVLLMPLPPTALGGGAAARDGRRLRGRLLALRGRLAALLPLLPAAALLLAWALGSETAGKGELGRMIGGAMAHEPPRWDALGDRPKVLFDHLVACYRDDADEALLYAMAGLVGLAALLRRRETGPAGAALAGPRALPLALALAALACGLLLPASYRGIWPIAGRMAPFVLMLLALLPRHPLRFGRATLGAGLLLCLATGWVHDRHFSHFDAEVGPLDEVLEALPPGPRVMTLIFDRDSTVVQWPAFMHFSQYALAARGGVAEFSFVNFTKSPVHYHEAEAPPRLPARFEWTPERYDHAAHGAYYSHILVRGDAGRAEARFRRGGAAMVVAAKAGPWTLYAHADGATADAPR